MTALQPYPNLECEAVLEAARSACQRVAPAWPLDRSIAVNPLWERRGQPWSVVAEQLWRRGGCRLTLEPEDYRQAWAAGRIAERHLAAALAERGLDLSPARLVALLDGPDAPGGLPLLEDQDEDAGGQPRWPELIVNQIGQFCAAWFDEAQADWHPDRRASLYGAWRDSLVHDRGLGILCRLPDLSERIRELPDEPEAALLRATAQLGLAAEMLEDWFDALLLRSLGWASWCAYRRWQARMAGADDETLLHLLAIRAAWECVVDDGQRGPGSRWSRWTQAWQGARAAVPSEAWQALQCWQRADELAWQEQLFTRLAQGGAKVADGPAPLARLYFCIDVRSERLRRCLERVRPDIETSGFAGFFGLPIAYQPLGTDAVWPQLPGLLAPQLTVADSCGDPQRDRRLVRSRRQRLARADGWRLFQRLPASAFSLVESLGLGYAGALLGKHFRLAPAAPGLHLSGLSARQARALNPSLDALPVEQRIDLAARVLTVMGLTLDFPPLVVLLGHGSQSTNNPQAAGLDCGACCGRSGEINARLLAALLNGPEVRQGLGGRGIAIPASCHFIAGLHNTLTDEVELFGREQVPAPLVPSLQDLEQALAEAGARVRCERAPSLGLAHLAEAPEALRRALHRRARDWSETRPEWGLANNAAFIAAPRARTRGLDLDGRAFLHDYQWRRDGDGRVLELIMTAPMVVAHWINLQYFASTTDNRHFGSGNKVLHNVVGGRIGVFEGNGGDLRIGLAQQSVHDGQRWMHTPLRLVVVIEAPRAMIDAVIERSAVVRDLVDNQWLHLFRLEGESARLEGRTAAGWQLHADPGWRG
ncbi:YbcC family protein [Metapseudomonas furukawaii]|uniref:YbcC family protein n=1 Tax=Metapseudomonas furukawaii TaxID=1149133 RepID=UPI004045E5B9